MIVKWTKEALQDLDTIELFIANDDPIRALDFIDELITLGDSLSDNKICQKGTLAKWTDNKNIRELYYKGYTIVYEIESDFAIIHEVYNQNRIFLRFGKR